MSGFLEPSVGYVPRRTVTAHHVVSWLLPDELEAPADLPERLPLPAPQGCIVPLAELKTRVAVEFGEERRAVRWLDSLLL